MGQTAKALGLGTQIDFDDGNGMKTYTLSGWNEGVKGMYELYLERWAISKARALRGYLPADEVATNDPVDGARRDITAGMYSFGTRLFRESLGSLRHLKYAILLQIQENHPEVGMPLVDQMFEQAADAILAAFREADADPNSKAPTPAAEPTVGA